MFQLDRHLAYRMPNTTLYLGTPLLFIGIKIIKDQPYRYLVATYQTADGPPKGTQIFGSCSHPTE